jgi:hypothetical protein
VLKKHFHINFMASAIPLQTRSFCSRLSACTTAQCQWCEYQGHPAGSYGDRNNWMTLSLLGHRCCGPTKIGTQSLVTTRFGFLSHDGFPDEVSLSDGGFCFRRWIPHPNSSYYEQVGKLQQPRLMLDINSARIYSNILQYTAIYCNILQ